MSSFNPILNELYARERIADYRRRQARSHFAVAGVQRQPRRGVRVAAILSKQLVHILAWVI